MATLTFAACLPGFLPLMGVARSRSAPPEQANPHQSLARSGTMMNIEAKSSTLPYSIPSAAP